jgi:hypothetical protein
VRDAQRKKSEMDTTEEKKEEVQQVDEKKTDATPAALSAEELQKKLDEMERHAKNKEEEAARVQKKLEKFQTDEDKRKKDELSEIDRLKLEKQEAETKAINAEATLQTERVRNSIYAEANKPQFGEKKQKFIKPEIAYQLLSDEDKAGDIAEALKKLAKENPFLLEALTEANKNNLIPKSGHTQSRDSRRIIL